jgi:hypothetical protein
MAGLYFPVRVALVLWCGFLAGCDSKPIAEVQGTVRVNGEAVEYGWVVFRNDQVTLQGAIQEGGAYTLDHRGSVGVPLGEYGVLLLPPEPKTEVDAATGAVRPGVEPDEQRYPIRCRRTETSGVRHTIGPGKQVIDIEFLVRQ